MPENELLSMARATRRLKDLTLADVSKTAGITPSHLSRIERRLRGASPEVIQRLAATLGVPPERLFGEAWNR